MSTERDVERIVRSWMDEGVTALPDRVLDLVLDQVPATPQRRPLWPSRRFSHVNKYAQVAIVAAVVLVAAVVGYNLLPHTTHPGGQTSPSAVPSATPTPLAAGTFRSHGGDIELRATGDGPNVTGTMTYTDEGGAARGGFVVDLTCTRTTAGGLILIGGPITESTGIYQESAPVGKNVAMVLQRGSPVKAEVAGEWADPHQPSCSEFLDTIPDLGDADRDPAALEPIEGTIELRP